jgi:hypothetical protein
VLGSLSHIVKHAAFGYEPLSPFPEVAPDSSKRRHLTASDMPASVRASVSRDDDDEEASSFYSGSETEGSRTASCSRSGSKNGSFSGSESEGRSRSRSRSRSHDGSESEV